MIEKGVSATVAAATTRHSLQNMRTLSLLPSLMLPNVLQARKRAGCECDDHSFAVLCGVDSPVFLSKCSENGSLPLLNRAVSDWLGLWAGGHDVCQLVFNASQRGPLAVCSK